MKLQQLMIALITTAPFYAMTSALADTSPNDELINTYLTVSKAQEMTTAALNGTMDYYKSTLPLSSEQVQTMRSNLDKAIGWDAIKPQIVEIIKKDYTSTALQSMIDYSNTSGATYNAQSIAFSHDYAAMLADRASQPQNKKMETTPITKSESLKSNNSLIAKDVVEHNINGKTYFTGIILNTGKKSLQHASVEINLFQGDTFVDQYSTYISGAIMPDTPRYFKVACGCENTPATHDHIKTLISTSMY